jgi:hypothetical protein
VSTWGTDSIACQMSESVGTVRAGGFIAPLPTP